MTFLRFFIVGIIIVTEAVFGTTALSASDWMPPIWGKDLISIRRN